MNTKLQLDQKHLPLFFFLILCRTCVYIIGFACFAGLFGVKNQRFGSCAYLTLIEVMNDKVKQCCSLYFERIKARGKGEGITVRFYFSKATEQKLSVKK